MAQKTSWTAATLTESDINTYLMHEGGAWTSWTPVVTQSNTPTITNTRSRYARAGRLIHFSIILTVTSAGTAANAILVSLPVTAASSSFVGMGTGYLFDASSSTYYPFFMAAASTTTFGLNRMQETTTPTLGVSGFSAALANGDLIRCHGFYESAS